MGDFDGDGLPDLVTNAWQSNQLAELRGQITYGCGGGGNYCPTDPVTRAQMAVFLMRTFAIS